jgi:hypothetical protein
MSAAPEIVRIERRFRGPTDSANGGYTAGLLAAHLSAHLAAQSATRSVGQSSGAAFEVTLKAPPPLDRPLRLETAGETAQLLDRDTLLAEARPEKAAQDAQEGVHDGPQAGTPDLPPAPGADAVAAAAGRFPGLDDHIYPNCFVCGPLRAAGDGLRIFAGPVAGERFLAAPWRPDPALADETGHVAPEFVWAALDCPGAFAISAEGGPQDTLLGRMTAAVTRAAQPGEALTVVARAAGSERRKHFAVTGLLDADGTPIAWSRQTWIALRRP